MKHILLFLLTIGAILLFFLNESKADDCFDVIHPTVTRYSESHDVISNWAKDSTKLILEEQAAAFLAMIKLHIEECRKNPKAFFKKIQKESGVKRIPVNN